MSSWIIEHPDRLALDGVVSRLDVTLVAGRLSVVGTDGPARVEVGAMGSRPLTVGLSDDGVLTICHQNMPKWPGIMWFFWWRRFRADVIIAVPPEAFAALSMVSGSVVASTLMAGAKIIVTSGRITLLGLDGEVSARIISGPIEALSVGGRVTLETVSGEITLAESTAHEVHAKTISGALTCDLDNPPENSEVRLVTTSGEITARVREDSDLTVGLHAVSGSVTSAFPELGGSRGTSLSGKLGKGTGQLYASAVSGNIALLRRPVDDEDVL